MLVFLSTGKIREEILKIILNNFIRITGYKD